MNQLLITAREQGNSESFDQIVNAIQTGNIDENDDLLDALRILLYDAPLQGYGDKYALFCENYLYRTDMPFISSMVLIMLCSYIYPVTKYDTYIKDALHGHEWDKERDLQTSASVLAEKLFKLTKDEELICILIGILKSREECRIFYTYEALLKIVDISTSISWRDWISNIPSSIVDWDLVNQLDEDYGCN